MEERQITTISFFRFEGRAARWWALQQMGLASRYINEAPGLEFFKLLGCGSGNGFHFLPDFGSYSLLGVWKQEEDARSFFDTNQLYREYCQKSTEHLTVFMRHLKSHGFWDGQNPFRAGEDSHAETPVAVLTRATIRLRHLLPFWRMVPKVSGAIEHSDGLLFSAGIGELPVVQQATFSLWRSSQMMENYAYKKGHHQKAIQKTRKSGWFKEEMFARFSPFAAEGSWQGKNPLEGVIV